MNTSYLDKEAFCDITFCLGKYEKDSIVKDCVEVSSLFKDIETLKKSMWMFTLRIETK